MEPGEPCPVSMAHVLLHAIHSCVFLRLVFSVRSAAFWQRCKQSGQWLIWKSPSGIVGIRSQRVLSDIELNRAKKTNKIYWQTEHRYDKLDHSKYRFSVPIARFQYIFALQLFVHLIWPRCTLHTDGRRYSDFMASLSGVLPIFIVLLDCARCVECCRHCSCVMSPLTHARTDAIEKLLRYSNVKPDFKYLVCC